MKTVTENREDLRVAAGLKVDDVNDVCTAEEERAAWPNQRCFYDFGVRPQAVFSMVVDGLFNRVVGCKGLQAFVETRECGIIFQH